MIEPVRKTKKKPGRPVKSVKRDIRAGIRFSKTEYFVIKENAAKSGLKPSEYIRQTAINASVKVRLTQEEKIMIKALIGMANNVNQIAKACHRENVLQAMFYFQSTIKELDEILKKLKNDQ